MAGTQRAQKAPRLDFTVTPEIIKGATQRDSSHCMIAEALAAAIPDAKYISVDLATIRFTDINAGWRYIYLTPRAAQEALLAFDEGTAVQPFQVRSLRAAQMVATGTARQARTNPGSRRGTELAKPPGNNGIVPTKVGGQTPPTGPISSGATGRAERRGKRREYGLRAYVR